MRHNEQADALPLNQSGFQLAAGLRLRKLIDVMGLTQVQAAAVMGVSKHVLRNWLAGENPIGAYSLHRLCLRYGVDFNYVYLGDPARLPHELAQKIAAEGDSP